MDKYEFGQWVKDEREQRGWSQSQLAIKAKMNRSLVNKVESGTSVSAPTTLTKLAFAFGYPQELVFEKAGLLTQKSELSPIKRQLFHMAEGLPDSDVELAVKVLEARVDFYAKNPQSRPEK